MAVSVTTILGRTSVRRFQKRALDEALADRVRHDMAVERSPGPFGATPRFALATADAMAAAGPLGTYGVIRDAPAFLVGASGPSVGATVDFGYRMEGLILKATAMGLGSCWLGGTFSRSAAAGVLPLQADEVIPAVSPLGHPSDRTHLVGDVLKLAARSSTRRAFGELFFDRSFDVPLTSEGAGRWGTVLECVRRAPSARNWQPWRIVLGRQSDGDRLHLFLAGEDTFDPCAESRTMHHLDVGIAMRHVVEAAEALGIKGGWNRTSDLPAPSVVPVLAYVATWSV